MQSTVQNLREGLWSLPSTVNSLLLAASASQPLPADTPDVVPKLVSDRDGNNNDGNDDGEDDADREGADVCGDDDEEEEGSAAEDDLPAVVGHQAERARAKIVEDECSSELMTSSVLSSSHHTSSNENAEPDDDELEAGSIPTEDSVVGSGEMMPYTLVREQWQAMLLGQEVGLGEISQAIETCKALIHTTDSLDENERKWLVRYLIELRYRRRELLDVDRDPEAVLEETKIILGHHFVRRRKHPQRKQRHLYCDHCSGVIWNVVQSSYVCSDCSFAVHGKCVEKVLRICAHVVTTEHSGPIECICPEIGLAFQRYTCAECAVQLSYHVSTPVGCFGLEFKAEKLNAIEPRLCDYTGLYYCPACHWNDMSIIPARIMNNWDFVPRKVCRASRQQIALLRTRPVIRLEDKNPRLFTFIPALAEVKRMRVQFGAMKKYLTVCRLADEERLVARQLGECRHLMQSTDLYSVADLVGIENGSLLGYLRTVYAAFEQHIRKCLICSGKAFICELCNNDAILFPFDACAISCARCNTVCHRDCFLRKGKRCAKCARLRKRALQTLQEQLDIENGN
ncbi:differentially expressed in FDCP 8 homolog isoform X2 [Anopheles albimanus]|uniref:Uncharacterized protein n=1 Tax=Anopheles albimanus TaxID=7167 RepID=A0A182FCA3_ANOAL|nr:differentially expressed in FDCP 8 homolog isoform X2 [Anopheles albimanus]